MASLNGKVALITGGSRGIGRAIAARLGNDGAKVVFSYVKHEDRAQELVALIAANGGESFAVQADVTQLADIQRLVAETLNHFGKLDILVNNAGGAFGFNAIAETSEEEYDKVFALNAKGPFFMMQAAMGKMADGGRVVNISSAGTSMPAPNGAAYIGSKGALEQFSYVLAKEVGQRGITVNVVSSGVTETDGLVAPPEMINWLINSTPLGRLGQPRDIADVVAFLVSDDARWITGQNIHATGGLA